MARELRLGQLFLGLGEPQIGEHIAAAQGYPDFVPEGGIGLLPLTIARSPLSLAESPVDQIQLDFRRGDAAPGFLLKGM